MTNIQANLSRQIQHIEKTVASCDRPAHSVQLLAVSKTKPASDIAMAYQAGQRRFGENYLQEALDKMHLLAQHDDIEWHFIGPIQSNKTRPLAEHFDWVQTVSRSKIAKRLSEQRAPTKAPLNVLLQVNISGEASKSGVTLDELDQLADFVSQLPNLQLRGLMAIPEPPKAGDNLDNQMQKMHQSFTRLKQTYPSMDTLSMGMSKDLDRSIQHGTTMVRLGTAIFGAREPK